MLYGKNTCEDDLWLYIMYLDCYFDMAKHITVNIWYLNSVLMIILALTNGI